MEHSWILMIFFICDKVVGEPCTSYQNVSETTLQNSWANSKCFPSSPVPAWYRFTSNAAGTLSVNCPATSSACGGTGNVWIKDSLPVYSDGTTSVKMCVNQGSNCCQLENALRTRNCNSFFVFELRRLPSCGIHYCFNKTDVTLVTVPTTTTHSTTSTTTTTTTTQPTTLTTTTQPTTSKTTKTSTILKTTTQSKTSKTATQSTSSATTAQPKTLTTTTRSTTSATTAQPKIPKTTAQSSTPLSKILGYSSPTSSDSSRNDLRNQKPNDSTLTVAVAVGASIGALILAAIIFVIVFKIYRSRLPLVTTDKNQVQPLRGEQVKHVKFNPKSLQSRNDTTLQNVR